MDLFLFTSRREGLSVAVLEALASGLPIVATDVGAIREQVEDGRNGYVVAVGDCEAMAGKCAELIRTPSLRASMGHSSRTIVEHHFSEQRMLRQYVDCYRAVARD